MADGPVGNLPPGLDAYGGYVNRSGIGITFPDVVKAFPDAKHLSITTDGESAMCADVESGAMSNWSGYEYGYCSVSRVNDLIAAYGRPKKLWTAHYDANIGAHICSPACWPGLQTTADGTQWTDHGNADWDESLLADDFFDPAPIPPPPPSPRGDLMLHTIPVGPLDAQGNGYEQTSIPWDTFQAATMQGSDPDPRADDAYWPGYCKVQDRGGNVLVSVVGALPGTTPQVYILATS